MKCHTDCKFKAGELFKYSNEDIELFKTYSAYQTPNSIKKHVNNKFDIFLILDMNSDINGDFSMLYYIWLGYKNRELNSKEQFYLWSRVGNKIDMMRKGGSKGNTLNLKTFFQCNFYV